MVSHLALLLHLYPVAHTLNQMPELQDVYSKETNLSSRYESRCKMRQARFEKLVSGQTEVGVVISALI